MLKYLLVFIGGGIGASARYWLSGIVYKIVQNEFPYGTFIVNTIGCFLIGFLIVGMEDRFVMSPSLRIFLTIGILGGFTTFSSFGYETVELLRLGAVRLAFWSVAGNVLLGLAAVLLGWGATRALVS